MGTRGEEEGKGMKRETGGIEEGVVEAGALRRKPPLQAGMDLQYSRFTKTQSGSEQTNSANWSKNSLP